MRSNHCNYMNGGRHTHLIQTDDTIRTGNCMNCSVVHLVIMGKSDVLKVLKIAPAVMFETKCFYGFQPIKGKQSGKSCVNSKN